MRIITTLITSGLLFFACCYLLIACSGSSRSIESSSRIENALGSEVYAILKAPKKVRAYRIVPQLKILVDKEPEAVGEVVELTGEQRGRLQSLLLNDKSYHFDLTKKCVFLGEVVFKFQKDKDVIVYVNPSCSQFKFVAEGRAVLLDYDPVKASVEDLLNELGLRESK